MAMQYPVLDILYSSCNFINCSPPLLQDTMYVHKFIMLFAKDQELVPPSLALNNLKMQTTITAFKILI